MCGYEVSPSVTSASTASVITVEAACVYIMRYMHLIEGFEEKVINNCNDQVK